MEEAFAVCVVSLIENVVEDLRTDVGGPYFIDIGVTQTEANCHRIWILLDYVVFTADISCRSVHMVQQIIGIRMVCDVSVTLLDVNGGTVAVVLLCIYGIWEGT